MALYHFTTRSFSRGGRNTVDSLAYRAGCKLYDSRTGQTFDYRDKPVLHVELMLPEDAPAWAVEIQNRIAEDRAEGVQVLCDLAEAAEKRIDSRVWREFEFSLQRELTDEQNMTLAKAFVKDQLCLRGIAALVNFHFDVDKKTGKANPHCHVTALTRRLEENGLSAKKERVWDLKPFLFELREQWANYCNFFFKLYGHDLQIDHRSNKERGIEMEPQPKRGRSVIEQEERAKKESVKPLKGAPVTDKMQAFRDVQLRNLYRIIRNPEIVLDIVTKHHATFMWSDVQKKLHQYVDDASIFERLDAKLKNSNELILLGMEKVRDASGMIQGKAIYTTRSMLEVEKALIETAEELGKLNTHGVQKQHIKQAISKANKELKMHGGLSQDQVKAIHHLVDEGQIKCVVGIAGAGKTTAIGVCHDIWKAQGYAVYGLAPTGKASQNLAKAPGSKSFEGDSLEKKGIPSTTVHKFLKAFSEGRCQYNEKSILVLDEAGMVDVGRFEKLLSAVKQLGGKLIVVGDGAQLQPVEAGPAFRLVTEKLGKVELNTVIRQTKVWQKEATVLFGQQKTKEAITKYKEKGYVHIVEEKLPSLKKVLANKDYENLVHLYEISHRVSSLIYREMAKDCSRESREQTGNHSYALIKKHKDFSRYLDWKESEKNAADHILRNAKACKSILEARGVDTLKIALIFKDKNELPSIQHQKARGLLKNCGLDHLIRQAKKNGFNQPLDIRKTAKEELIRSWHKSFKTYPEKSSTILAFSNKDVNDLNGYARYLLKQSGHILKGEISFNIKKEIEDDFGRTHILKEQKTFSKGDRIVFTKNRNWLGVSNGTMGIITELDNRKIRVKLEDEKEISFAPNLNPYFDHGWAVTIHKSQGTTVDQVYVLASYEMTQNLTYVSMTRHRDEVKVFGSSLDFWRPEKLPEVISKSGEKLSAADYLDADSLSKIMKRDDQLITKIFQRLSNELEAMGAVTKHAFWQVADRFLGIQREKEIRIGLGGTREEVRAEELLKQETPLTKSSAPLKNYSFNEITVFCEKRLHDALAQDNESLTPEREQHLLLQAEKTAAFLVHAYERKQRSSSKPISFSLKEPTLQKFNIKDLSLRAKYELTRIPEIRKELIENWKDRDQFDETRDLLLAHMIAERLASIEGRIYLVYRQKGMETPSDIANRANEELTRHRAATPKLAETLSKQHALAHDIATHCAKDVFRYKETHGEMPSEPQIKRMVEITKTLDVHDPYKLSKTTLSPIEVDYCQRKERDLLLWHTPSQEHSDAVNIPHIQIYAKKSLDVATLQIAEELHKINQKELS